MRSLRTLFLVTVVTIVITALVPVIGSAIAVDSAVETTVDDSEDANTTLGAQVGSFMQSSSTNAEWTVEDEMFKAELETADDKSAVLDRRQQTLADRLSAVEDRKMALDGDSADDVVTSIKMSRVASEVHSLERDINSTREVAANAGASPDRFNSLERDVTELRGPNVATAAGQIPGGPAPEEVGPPEEVSVDDGDGHDTGEADRSDQDRETLVEQGHDDGVDHAEEETSATDDETDRSPDPDDSTDPETNDRQGGSIVLTLGPAPA